MSNNIEKFKKLLSKKYRNDNKYQDILIKEKDDCILLEGELDNYNDIIEIGQFAASTKLFYGVINEIKLKGYTPKPIRHSSINDLEYDNLCVDVLVVGGGITGCAILRELSKYDLNICLVEKENDVALHASSRNDGCIHIGIDLKKGSKKLEYLQRSVGIYEDLANDLGVNFKHEGQTIALKNSFLGLAPLIIKMKAKENKIPGVKILNKKEIHQLEPNLNKEAKIGIYFPTGGTVCPYNMTIGLAESAVLNGAKVLLNTVVLGMKVMDEKIYSVETNRGTIYPKVVVNAGGVFADDIAEMAEDKFFSIHPRKGTNIILDKNSRKYLARTSLSLLGLKKEKEMKKSHTKGGGIVPTVDGNILVGPTANEVIEKEDFTTESDDINKICSKHIDTTPLLNKSDIITYFSGIRAATYEEDFIIQKGKWTKNIVHAAGIQSPGLTAAPAIAIDITKFCLEILGKNADLKANFIARRDKIINPKELSDEKRNELIKINPNYGQIVCRCEEISKGEIIDAINSIIPVNTIDAIKRRTRAGMGRCQGGFCQVQVIKLISEELGIKLEDINKKGEGRILFDDNKIEGNVDE